MGAPAGLVLVSLVQHRPRRRARRLAVRRHRAGHPQGGRLAALRSPDGRHARKAVRQGGVQRVSRRGRGGWRRGRARRPRRRPPGPSCPPASRRPSRPRRRARSAPSSRRTAAPGPPGRTRSRRSRRRCERRLATLPAGAKALAGGDGFLFYARSMSYVLGGDLGKQRGGQEPDPGHRPFPRPAGQARRRPAVRAGSHQGRDLSRAGRDRAGRGPGAAPPFRRAGREPVRAEVPARAGGKGGRDRRSASRVPERAREGSGVGQGRAALSGGGHALGGARARAGGQAGRRARAPVSLVPAAGRASARVSNQGRLLHAPRRSLLAPAGSRAGKVRARPRWSGTRW